jgi:hypothetical protein
LRSARRTGFFYYPHPSMARTLKLDCITLSVTERNSSKLCSFDEFFRYKLYDGTILPRPFADFFTKYVESFNGEFKSNAAETKAIHFVPGSVSWNARRRTISGIAEGGNRGSTADIKASKKAGETILKLSTDHVYSEPFHFLLWMPADFDKGILLLQGYTNATISDAYKQSLVEFFKEQCPRFTLRLGTYVDPETVKDFMNGAKANEVIFRRTRVAPDLSDDTERAATATKEVTVDVSVRGLNNIEGFTDRLSRWVKSEVPSLFEVADMEGLGVDGEYETIVKYKNPDGHRASANSRRGFEIKPQIYVPKSEVACEVDGRPDSAKMSVYLLKELARIQQEIGYAAATNS